MTQPCLRQPTRTLATLAAAALSLVTLAAPAPARAEATWALSGDCPDQHVGLLIGFEQSTNAPWAGIPFPFHRPTFRIEMVGGLPGPVDLWWGGRLGNMGFLRPEYELMGGLRLAPHDLWDKQRPAFLLTGGFRAVPGDPTYLGTPEVAHPAVGVTRIEFLHEAHGGHPGPAFLWRLRYEMDWTLLVETTHAERETSTARPFVSSHVIETRIGFVSRPDLPASFLLETGFYVYVPNWGEANVLHAGVIISLAGAMGPKPATGLDVERR